MTLTTKVLIGLGAGLAVGAAIASSDSATLHAIPAYLEPVGTIWVNALRMIVIPLVVSAIIVGINSLPDSQSLGRIGGRAFALCVLILVCAATYAVVVGPLLMAGLHIDPAASEAMRASASSASANAIHSAEKIVTFSQWLVDIVPPNPIKAAADGAMLPLIAFTVLLGMAITRIGAEHRGHLLKVMQATLDASLIVVGWVLLAAPVGVFALTVPLANKLGIAAAGAVVYYVVVVSGMCIAFCALLYVAARVFGKQGFANFAKACAPAQAVAITSRSSIVTLPAMLDGADRYLALPFPVRTFFFPLAASIFRAGSAVMIPVGAIFMARLYGVTLDVEQLATIAVMSIVTTFSVPGIPGGTIIVMVPVLLAAHVPVAAVGLLLGVDTIPDMFRTTTHVTADMAAASILARFESR
jgi:Na+/H+-dicarboxylate symporter